MVISSPEHTALGLRRVLSPSKTLPIGISSITRNSDVFQLGEGRTRASTLPHQSGDEPIFSRNIPSAFSIVSCSSDKDEISFSNSMLYIEDDILSPRNLSPVVLDLGNIQNPEAEGDHLPSPSQVAYRVPFDSSGLNPNGGVLDGLLGCFRMWNFIGKAKPVQIERDDWEIPFENINDLQWLGSGAQGAVFSGKLMGELVAVKKVREEFETDIKHLRKLNHPNIVEFRGVCTQSPVYCIVMEYCPYGPLFNLLREGKEIPPKKLVDWTKQIATGMNYLHQHKIIHRDLKSPNILIGRNDIIKISDFGTSRQWSEHSTKMSFAGTVAWMPPEVIRNEPCNEKVDIWSFGVCVWELLTCELPYKNVDSSAIIWGVGSNSLQLPIPSSCPDGFKLLIKQCWSSKPRNRPSFRHILMHLDIAAVEILSFKPEDYFRTQQSWKAEVWEYNEKMRCEGSSIPLADEVLVKKRKEELKHAQDVRELYERKLERTNNLYLELNAVLLRIEQREQELSRRELLLQSGEKASHHMSKKKLRPIMNKAGRIQKKCELGWRNISPGARSTSPDSPVHGGAAAKPIPVESCRRLAFTEIVGKGTETSLEPKRGQINSNGLQYHPTSDKMKIKKTKHKRSGSHGSSNISPRDSPNRDRRSASQGEAIRIPKQCEAETQTEPCHSTKTEMQMRTSTPDGSPNQEFSFDMERSIRSDYSSRTPSVSRTPRQSSASLNGNVLRSSPGLSCECPGCPGNPLTFPEAGYDEENSNIADIVPEDYLDTLDRKVNEIMNRDCSRRSSQHDLGNKGDSDMYGPLSFSYGRKKTLSDLNCNQTTYSPRVTKVPAPEGTICFEDDGKESSSEAIESSQEDLSQVWSEDEDHYVLRRRSLLRRPIRAKNRNSLMSMRSISTVSSEEGEASEYPSSQRSTLESNPDLQNQMAAMAINKQNKVPNLRMSSIDAMSDESIDEDDDLSVVTVTTARDVTIQGP